MAERLISPFRGLAEISEKIVCCSSALRAQARDPAVRAVVVTLLTVRVSVLAVRWSVA